MSVLAPHALAALPVFPLPRLVLLPHQKLPLRIFEPRYRAMMEDCLSRGPRAMAVAQLRPGWEPDYEGRPPIFDVAGAGVFELHETLSDGTYGVLLVGVARVRLEELPADGLAYRRARATVLADEGVARVEDVAALHATVRSLSAAVRRVHPTFALPLGVDDDPARVADVVADCFVQDPAVRQRVLEAVDVGARVALVTEILADVLTRAEKRVAN